MYTLIVCGTPWCDLYSLGEQLRSAGWQPAAPAARSSIPTIAEWHDRLFIHRTQASQPVQPGKAWEQAAGEIFLANWEHPLWGWADHRSTWLLDFWQQFDEQTRFILVHTPAVDALVAAALDSTQPELDANRILDGWSAYQKHMLEFYLRHRERCVWYCQPSQGGATPADVNNGLQTHQRLTLPQPWAEPLSLVLSNAACVAPVTTPGSDPGMALLQRLAQQAVQQHPAAALVQGRINATVPGLQSRLPPAQAATGLQASALLSQVRDAGVLHIGSLREQLQVQGQSAQALHAQLASASAAQAELQRQLQATQEGHAKATEENKRLQQQLQTVQQAQASSELAAARQAKAALERQLQALQAEQKEANEENELLLLQLHQVQEELENYFLRHQEAQQTVQQLQERLTRWAQRYPDHCEWESLAVLPQTEPHQQDVLITQLQHGGRTVPHLHLQLQRSGRKHAQHRIVLQRSGDQPAPLLHWPQESADGSRPAAPATALAIDLPPQPGTPQAAALAALAPSDLQLLRATSRAIAAHLADQHSPGAHDAAAWARHWQASATALAEVPTTWRYDHLSLRHEQVNPDYEHLWLHFDNAEYGERRWPAFEFRLSASNVRKGQFSHLPKLEFPLPENAGPKQFENWFEESEDDKGPKFELRFDIRTPGMDIACWNALSTQDQAQLAELVRQLPSFLERLEHSGTAIHRPWADWHGMVDGIRRALRQCVGIDNPDGPASTDHPQPTAQPELELQPEPAPAPTPAKSKGRAKAKTRADKTSPSPAKTAGHFFR